MDGHDAVVHFAAESHVDRSIVDPDAFVRTNCAAPTSLCDVGPPRRGRALPAHLHRRGVRLDRQRRAVHRDRPARPRSPVLRVEGGLPTSSPCAYHETSACPSSSPARRTTSGPTSSPRRSSRCSSPTCSTGSKVPLYGDGLEHPRLVLRRRQLRRRRPRAARGRRSARSTTSAPATRSPTGSSPTACSALTGQDESTIEYVEPTASATTAATRSTRRQGPTRSAGSRRASSTRRSPRRSAGTATTAVVGAAARPRAGRGGVGLVSRDRAEHARARHRGRRAGRARARRRVRAATTSSRPTTPQLDVADRDAVLGADHRRRARRGRPRRGVDRGRRVRGRSRPGVRRRTRSAPRHVAEARAPRRRARRATSRPTTCSTAPRPSPTTSGTSPTRSRCTGARSSPASEELDAGGHDRAHVVGVRRTTAPTW